MSQLLDPNWNRATFLPYARHKQTGQGSFAVPQVVADLLSAVMLPGDVYQGNVLLNDPETGRTSDQVIRRSADLAGALTLGAGAVPAQKSTLRMGAKAMTEKQKKYPIAPRGEWYGDANYEMTGGKLTEMTPDEFLAQVRPLEIDDVARDNIDDLKRHILEGRTLDPLQISAKGKEDGRHRAIAAKELGIKIVPVLRWDK